jgi:hypothetical protein
LQAAVVVVVLLQVVVALVGLFILLLRQLAQTKA